MSEMFRRVGARLFLAVVAVAMISICALAEEKTAEDWAIMGEELLGNGSVAEAIPALEKAIELFNESIRLNPGDHKAWLGKAHALYVIAPFKEMATNESIAGYEKVIEIDPRNIEAWIGMGNALYTLTLTAYEGQDRNKLFENALKAFDTAIEIDPINVDAWSGKGIV
ncbi:tetratricopeptide repeat protein, partial [Methanothrix sp.]|uniref:tetratricopeptide repeat protein n=1 Tax=Methanothrix sp. TaxID=90426 RepID=UPI003BB66CBF